MDEIHLITVGLVSLMEPLTNRKYDSTGLVNGTVVYIRNRVSYTQDVFVQLCKWFIYWGNKDVCREFP